MLRTRILLCVLLLAIFPARALERPEVTFKVFQFPPNMIPRIDGNDDDWAMVPDSYAIGMDQLEDTEAPGGDGDAARSQEAGCQGQGRLGEGAEPAVLPL